MSDKTTKTFRVVERRDEVKHGVFSTTYVVETQGGAWRGDYSTWERANERARQLNGETLS